MLVIHNTSKPVSTLKKKYNVIAYHGIHESVAMRETSKRHIRSENNPVDILTKIVNGHNCKHLVSLVLYDIYDGDI